jgi:hypothetical protein
VYFVLLRDNVVAPEVKKVAAEGLCYGLWWAGAYSPSHTQEKVGCLIFDCLLQQSQPMHVVNKLCQAAALLIACCKPISFMGK